MTMQALLIIGLIVNSALFLTSAIAASLVTGNRTALLVAFVAIGVTYLSYAVQVMAPGGRKTAACLVLLSAVTSAVAGIALFVP